MTTSVGNSAPTVTVSSASVGMSSHYANILPSKIMDTLACQSNAENWHLWKQQWTNYAIVTGLGTRDLVFQRAMFRSTIGSNALQVFNTMVFPSDQCTVEDVFNKFEVMMNGELNETYERLVFNS